MAPIFCLRARMLDINLEKPILQITKSAEHEDKPKIYHLAFSNHKMRFVFLSMDFTAFEKLEAQASG